MESDVATAHFARVHGVPVPRIYAFDSSAANCLGIEWQLVQKIPDEDVNFINGIMAEEEEALLKIGSLYWDFENRDFVMGPVSSHFFTRGRRILYQQRQDHDGGDPRLPLLRGPFRTVGEYLNAKLTIMLWEADDKTLRNDDKDGQPIIFKKPGCEADGTTATPAAVTSPEYASGEDEDPERTWYRNLHVDKVRDQVPKIRDIVLPWIEAKLKPEQRERVRTFISHPDLHSPNLLVSRRARARDHSGGNSNLLGEEYAVTAILDWEHTIALPDYLIQPVGVATYFRAMPDTKCCPWLSERPIHIERLFGDAGDGGRAARSPWHGECFPDPLKVSGGFVPWRRCDDDGPGHGSGAAGAVRGGGRGVRPGKAATRCVAAPPRDLTNAEVLLYFICGQLEDVVGSRSEFWVDPFVDKIQAHMASEPASERSEGEM
ncbi:putative aminoglycoside phosphotransferase [Diaporthe ampelina]|uniref:Putative aminoglycoside phosphotransferase n=1 Tax=Diaporthe ampelina TaxID=1214573 RepID=A0A0G2G0T3_9PEZI|nr:putative aminoglycoside phosphotransferase [Diaporthe ampelina]